MRARRATSGFATRLLASVSAGSLTRAYKTSTYAQLAFDSPTSITQHTHSSSQRVPVIRYARSPLTL